MKLVIVFFILFLASCSENSPKDLIEPQIISTKISYQNNVKQIISNNCVICHGTIPSNGAPMSLNDFESLKNSIINQGLLDRINLDTQNSSAMPLGGPKLQQSQIEIITRWQSDGFLN